MLQEFRCSCASRRRASTRQYNHWLGSRRATPSEDLTSNREAVGVPREWGQSTRSRGSGSNRPPLGPAGRGHRKRKPGTPVRPFFPADFHRHVTDHAGRTEGEPHWGAAVPGELSKSVGGFFSGIQYCLAIPEMGNYGRTAGVRRPSHSIWVGGLPPLFSLT